MVFLWLGKIRSGRMSVSGWRTTFSTVHPRVRQLQSFVVDLAIAAVQEVDVYSGRETFF